MIYFILLYAASLLFGYVIAFNGATFHWGRSLSVTDSPTGYQNAITPPWYAIVAYVTYAVSLAVVGYGWYKYGWLAGIGITFGFFALNVFNTAVVLPKSDSNYFRNLIVRSMIKETDFVKSGDQLREAAMGDLLDKMGIPIAELTSKRA